MIFAEMIEWLRIAMLHYVRKVVCVCYFVVECFITVKDQLCGAVLKVLI